MTFLNDEIMAGTDWRAVERAVARVMSHCGWKCVQIVGRSGDAGGDVLGVRQDSGRRQKFVVQVKAVMNGYVGPEAIQEAVDALSVYNGDVAVVATNGEFTKPAYLRRDTLRGQGFDVRLWNGAFLQQLLASAPEEHPDKRSLREYQRKIVERSMAAYREGKPHVLFIVATGLGKTVIAAEIVRSLMADGKRRVLVLCHSRDLALQLEQSFWPYIGKSTATRVFFDGESPRPVDGLNFGLYQTLTAYLGGLTCEDFQVVVVDEAHHAAAGGFVRCLNSLAPDYLIGMTATPWRGDGLSIEAVFGQPVSTVSLVDGMKMGYLARVDYRIYSDSIDWERVPRLTGGDFTISDLNKRLFVPQRDEAVITEINKLTSEVRNPKVIIFCPSIEHCRRFTDLMNLFSPLKCRPVSGVDKLTRYKTITDFAAGKIDAVAAVDVLNEGIDVPDTNIIVFLRCTHSRRIFVQQLGRGLRISPETGKTKVVVLDFVADIRRLADVMRIDKEAKTGRSEFHNLVFEQGVVSFSNEATRSFVEQWLADVADLGDSDESQLLHFPGL